MRPAPGSVTPNVTLPGGGMSPSLVIGFVSAGGPSHHLVLAARSRLVILSLLTDKLGSGFRRPALAIAHAVNNHVGDAPADCERPSDDALDPGRQSSGPTRVGEASVARRRGASAAPSSWRSLRRTIVACVASAAPSSLGRPPPHHRRARGLRRTIVAGAGLRRTIVALASAAPSSCGASSDVLPVRVSHPPNTLNTIARGPCGWGAEPVAWMRMMGVDSVDYHEHTVAGRGDDPVMAAAAYYASRGETPMVWGGRGRALLGLDGEVDLAEYRALFGPGGAHDPHNGDTAGGVSAAGPGAGGVAAQVGGRAGGDRPGRGHARHL